MKKRNISDIQNILAMVIAFLVLVLLNKKDMAIDIRFTILTIVLVIYVIIMSLGIKKFIDEHKNLDSSQKLVFFMKEFFLVLVLVGYFIVYYMNLKEYLLVR